MMRKVANFSESWQLCRALGWDVANRQGYAEAYKDVVREAR
jgi:hypothetical protein